MPRTLKLLKYKGKCARWGILNDFPFIRILTIRENHRQFQFLATAFSYTWTHSIEIYYIDPFDNYSFDRGVIRNLTNKKVRQTHIHTHIQIVIINLEQRPSDQGLTHKPLQLYRYTTTYVHVCTYANKKYDPDIVLYARPIYPAIAECHSQLVVSLQYVVQHLVCCPMYAYNSYL